MKQLVTKNVVVLSLPAQAEYVDIVRLTLYGIATKMGFPFEDIEDMKVAVAEACNNVVVHAYEGRGGGTMEVRFDMHLDGLSIIVKDDGKSFDVERASAKAVSLHDKPLSEVHAGGLGLYMMQALMDEVTVHSDSGTEVMLTKRLSRSEKMA